MAFDAQRVTLIGNLTDDPVLRGEGEARRATFRVACNKGKDDKKKSSFFNVTAFNGRYEMLADNVVATLRKGMRVIVDGDLEQYDVEAVVNGETKNITVTTVRAYSVGPDLNKASADVTKNPRQDDNGGGQWQPQGQPQGNFQQQAAPAQQAPQGGYQQAPQGQPQYAAAAPGGDVF